MLCGVNYILLESIHLVGMNVGSIDAYAKICRFFFLILGSKVHVSAFQWDCLFPQQRSPRQVNLY